MKLRKKIILSALAALAVSCFAAACTVQNPPEVPPENPPGVTDPEDFKQIKISGADDIKITQGAFFDCFAGVSAVNADGKDLSAYLNVSGNLNTSRAGEYFLVYYVTDLNGVTVEKQRKITVEANPAIGRVKPVPVYSIIGGADYNIAEGCGANVTATSNGSENKALDG
ncbi:MAG: DUF5011 domain-containing protein, partial [Clostridia bacterium]|nr:DUF5011 domain-containing protein [Clostridia bacterium]